MNSTWEVDSVLKPFSLKYSIKLILGAKDDEIRLLDFGHTRIRIEDADLNSSVQLGIMEKEKFLK